MNNAIQSESDLNQRMRFQSNRDIFDENACNYYSELNRGISLSGETADYFAEFRTQKSAELANSIGLQNISQVLDFGCGIGTAAPFLSNVFPDAMITGSDVASAAIDRAKKINGSQRIRFVVGMDSIEQNSMNLAYCNGVFHHIALADRDTCLKSVYRVLKPGGIFCFWENNPWNPGTQFVMRRIPFDRDAICLSVLETKRRMKRCGFESLVCQSCFYFPACLSALRPVEKYLAWLPLGAQYVCVGIKPPMK